MPKMLRQYRMDVALDDELLDFLNDKLRRTEDPAARAALQERIRKVEIRRDVAYDEAHRFDDER